MLKTAGIMALVVRLAFEQIHTSTFDEGYSVNFVWSALNRSKSEFFFLFLIFFFIKVENSSFPRMEKGTITDNTGIV